MIICWWYRLILSSLFIVFLIRSLIRSKVFTFIILFRMNQYMIYWTCDIILLTVTPLVSLFCQEEEKGEACWWSGWVQNVGVWFRYLGLGSILPYSIRGARVPVSRVLIVLEASGWHSFEGSSFTISTLFMFMFGPHFRPIGVTWGIPLLYDHALNIYIIPSMEVIINVTPS